MTRTRCFESLSAFPLASLVSFVLAASPGYAVDGIVEIHQACVAAGCVSGDDPGYPIELDRAGSYRLTSNLTLTGSDSTALFVQADDVTIDLNGFEIRGPIACSIGQNGLQCAGGSLGVAGAIFAGPGVRRTVVRNGSIVGATRAAIEIGSDSLVEDVYAAWNLIGGIRVGNRSTVRGCIAHQNFGSDAIVSPGIFAGSASRVEGSTASENARHGIEITLGATAVDNKSADNERAGLVAGFYATIRDNTIIDNEREGLQASGHSTITGNVISRNGFEGLQALAGASTIAGNVVSENGRDGVEAGSGTIVRDNVIQANGLIGLELNAHATYSDNILNSNGTDQVSGGQNTGGNYCVGPGTTAPTCP